MKVNSVNLVIIVIIIATFSSCNFYGDVNLGNGYYLGYYNSKYREISYTDKNIEGFYPVVKKHVISYAVNDSVIFIKTSDYIKEEIIVEFYIIKKDELDIEQCNSADSLFNTITTLVKDSTIFHQILSDKGLSLKE